MTCTDTFLIKVGDLLPAVVATALDAAGVAVDLSDVESVVFRMWSAQGNPDEYTVDAPAVVTDAAAGVITYSWVAGDTDTAGTYFAEFVVTWVGDLQQTFPTDGAMTGRIQAHGLSA